MSKPLLSVCLPNYNHSRYLPGAVQALCDQSERPDEIVIVDDASSDDSVSVIEEMCRTNPTIKLLRNDVNEGCCRSVNRAIEEASGEFVFLTAADDRVLPGYFAKVLSCFRKHPSAGVCVTQIKYIDDEGNRISGHKLLDYHSHEKHVKIQTPLFLSRSDVLRRLERQPWFICGGPSPLYRREVVMEAGGWHEPLGPYTDWFMVHFAALRYGMAYVPEPLVEFRVAPWGFGETSARNPLKALEQIRCLIALMEEDRFGSVFPETFIRQKRKEFAYIAFRGNLVGSRRDLNNALEQVMPPTSLVDRLLLQWHDILFNAEKLALKLYCTRKANEIFGLTKRRSQQPSEAKTTSF